MSKENEEVIEGAYWLWLREYMAATKVLNCGSLKKARHALFRTAASVAQEMNISQAAYAEIEKNESSGRVRMVTLAKAAEALGCDLVYFIVPKNTEGQPPQDFARLIWNQLRSDAEVSERFQKASSVVKTRTLAAVAVELMRSPAYRRRKKWTTRRRT